MVTMTNEQRARIRAESLATIQRVDRALAQRSSDDDERDVQSLDTPGPPFDWRSVQVEDAIARYKREGNEATARREAFKQHLKSIEDEGRRRAEAHQLAVIEAQAKAVADTNDAVLADALKVIGDGLNSLIDRVETIERRLDHESIGKGVSRRAKSSAR
jgi:hypothetical protein